MRNRWVNRLLPMILLLASGWYATAATTPGITIITHGFQLQGRHLPEWVRELAEAIKTHTGENTPIYRVRYEKGGFGLQDDRVQLKDGATSIDIRASGNAIIMLDWAATSNETVDYPTQVVADRFFSFLFGQTHNDHNLAELPIHLIGHSRGGSLVSRLGYLLAENGILVDHITFLDPHPVIGANANDWPAAAYSTTLFADNYYRTGALPEGVPVNGALNFDLSSVITGVDCTEHESVHTYYFGTANLTKRDDGRCDIRTRWYSDGFPRNATGHIFSRARNPLIRPPAGITKHFENSTGTAGRVFVSSENQLWPNVVFDENQTFPSSVHVGQQISIAYYYADFNSEETITFAIDSDMNPFNGLRQTIGIKKHSSLRDPIIRKGTLHWTPSVQDVGERYVVAEATNSRSDMRRTRYDYIRKPVTILNVLPSAVPSSLAAAAVLPAQADLSCSSQDTNLATEFE